MKKPFFLFALSVLLCLLLLAACSNGHAGASAGSPASSSAAGKSAGSPASSSAAGKSAWESAGKSAGTPDKHDAAASSAASGDDQIPESALKNDPLWADPDSVTAMVVSDLHYTDQKNLDHSLVPGLALSGEIADALIDEVIDRHPDVLIMTGDNTNSGGPEEVSGLTARLRRIKEEGIGIIITTGNHDFDRMDASDFEKNYFGLLTPVDRDPASLSYTAIVKDLVFLAMDDNAVYPGGEGKFSQETMKWLTQMLEKYRGSRIIFLSHHNVLYGRRESGFGPNLIGNPDLPVLLRKNKVQLAMTGHMHAQYIMEKEGLWEVLSGMPFSGSHFIGHLAVSRDRAVYYAEPIDFAAYDNDLAEKLEKLDRESADSMTQTFSALLDRQGLKEDKKSKVLDLINRFFMYYNSGSLAEHAEELRKDPSYKTMLRTLWDYNYGRWMKEMIETTKHNARELELNF
ncbi:MAG: metallophosphoesterase [Lachnospiraceae bacterium]|nr:metallophosphoesterase [Lachnospiraceae bacterium]